MTTLDQLSINTIRFLSADGVQQANSGHPGLPMGAASMAYTLWAKFLKHFPHQPNWINRDRFILSGGHGSMLLYSLLHLTGYDLPLEEIKNFRQWNSLTPGHPEVGLTPGVEVTTGPLGAGFATGVGLAIAEAHLAARYNQPGLPPLIDHYTYAIVTDGDLMEGVASEAASLAGHLQLGKLIYLYDDNHISIDGGTELAFTEDRAARFAAYGWHVQTVSDGNDVEAIAAAIQAARAETARPSLICVRTVIGYGSPKRQGTAKAHGEPLGDEELNAAKANLGWQTQERFHIPTEVKTHLEQAVTTGEKAYAQWKRVLSRYRTTHPALTAEFERVISGKLPADWQASLPTYAPSSKGAATRNTSGEILNALAKVLPELMGGSADLAPSNKTWLKDEPAFSPATPAGRNFHFGVREHAMGNALNGLALHGGILPYGGTFLVFYDYMRPTLRLAALSHLQTILIYTHDSIGVGEDGPTHQPIEHLSGLRAVPNLLDLRPCDANETVEAWKAAIGFRHGPSALALTRQNLPILDRTQFAPASGLHQGAYILSEAQSGKPKVILIASGSEVSIALASQTELQAQGIATRVVSMPSWKLFADQPQSYRDQVLLPSVRARVAIEAASPMGWERWVGLDGAVVGLNHFGASAPAETLYEKFGLTASNLTATALHVLAKLGTAHPLLKLQLAGQSPWQDNITRSQLKSGELARLISAGDITGLTSNPAIFEKAIAKSNDYSEALAELAPQGLSAEAVFYKIAIEDIQAAADAFLPVYQRTQGLDGYVSIEVSPRLAYDTEGTIREAQYLWQAVNRPNTMIKIPATRAGLPAITAVLSAGINVNVTLIFSLERYQEVMDAHIAGLELRRKQGLPVSGIASVASFFVSRVDSSVDKQLETLANAEPARAASLRALQGQAAVGNARLAYQAFERTLRSKRWQTLAKLGAQVQRPLWASTSVKNPNYRDVLYVETLIGLNTVNTMPPETLVAYRDHGITKADSVRKGWASARQLFQKLAEHGIHMSEVTAELERAGVDAFIKSYEGLLKVIEQKLHES